MASVKSAMAPISTVHPPTFSVSFLIMLKSPPINQGASLSCTSSIHAISPRLLVLVMLSSFSSSDFHYHLYSSLSLALSRLIFPLPSPNQRVPPSANIDPFSIFVLV